MFDELICNYTPTISVVIPTYNRAEMLWITVESFIKQNYPKDKYEIIVVNNNSTDNTESIIKTYLDLDRSHGVKINYLFEKRQGVHFARNTAAKHASFDILYYTDDDMIADPNLLREIVKPFFLDNKIATVTGRVLPKWEKLPPKWIITLCYNGWLSLNDRKEDLIISSHDCGVFSCHQAIRKNVFFEAGGFNPENTAGVWVGDGETGLNIKIRDLGYKFAYIGSSVIYHMIPRERMTQDYLNKRLKNQGASDSYTAFRSYRYSKKELYMQIVKHIIKIPFMFIGALLLSLYRWDSSWRFGIAYIYYYLQRIEYDMKLIRNDKWRNFVSKCNWLDG